MKYYPVLFAKGLCVAMISMLLPVGFVVQAEIEPVKTDSSAIIEKSETEDAQKTIVDSDTFKLDMGQHVGVFVGNVHVVDPSFDMTGDQMTVYFDKNNKIDHMVAQGNIVIRQIPNQNSTAKSVPQSATSQQAEYSVVDKKLKLTGNPIVQQGDNKVTGNVIYLYPGSDRMDVEGRSKVRFYSNQQQQKK